MKKNLKEMLDKANELRALFIFGQRVIPFLEEIFIFVSEIEPLLEEINISIAENLKKMPSATKQLSKVTEATELATTEIMDILDNLTFKTDVISRNLNHLRQIKDHQIAVSTRLLEILHKGIQANENLNDYLPEISKVMTMIKENEAVQFDKTISETNSILESINMDSSSIMMSLQVQDITSQQLAAVNHLIETVQEKLMKIIERFDKTNIENLIKKSEIDSNINVSKLHRDIAFDPDAVKTIEEKSGMQSSVDELIKMHKAELNKEEQPIHTLQEDIDKLVSLDITEIENQNIDFDTLQKQLEAEEQEQTAEKTQNIVQENNVQPVDENLENFDLDNLDEPFSQDDIDALFGKK